MAFPGMTRRFTDQWQADYARRDNGLPLITVLIDTYNYGHFIEKAIDSVLTQDFPAEMMQVLVVDDGSTDDTAERVKKYGSRVQYLYKANGGQGSAFNLGIERASGEFILLLDADDYFLPGKVRRVVEEFQKDSRVGMVYHAYSKLYSNTGQIEGIEIVEASGFLPDDLNKLFGCGLYPTSCLSFRRELVRRFVPIPEAIKLQADSYLNMLAVITAPVRAIGESLMMYRVHGKNLYYEKEEAATVERRRWRGEMSKILVREVEAWTRAHAEGLRREEKRLYVRHWSLLLASDSFFANPPSRLRFFFFLWKQNGTYTRIQTWKFTLFHYLSAFSALVFGYKRAREMHEWKERTIGGLQRLFKSEWRE
jgi:glycosyltransferase involved in cell wall biosynthesis